MHRPKSHGLLIRAVSFDADDTLWDFQQVMRRALQYSLDELRQHQPRTARALTVEVLVDVRNRVAARLRGQRLEQVRLEAFRETLREFGRPDDALAERLNEVYLAHRFADVHLYADVLPALEALQRQGLTLGLVSNGNGYPDRCGLDGRFRFTVFAQDHGVEKPDPALFEIALRQAGCAPEQMLHVGDSLHSDVQGAQRAGLHAVWLNRKGRPNDTGIVPDYEIRSLASLPPALWAMRLARTTARPNNSGPDPDRPGG